MKFFDLSFEPDLQKFFEIEELLTKSPFTIINSDLFQITYIKLSGESAIFFKFHHLIADAWSLILTVDNILSYYLRLKNKEKTNDEIAISYVDYLNTEKKYLVSEQFMKNKAFWQTKVSTIPEFIYLRNRPIQYSPKAKRISFIIPENLSIKINQYCKDNKVSVFTLFTAIFSIYINQTTSKNDIIIGTTVLNRLNHSERNTIGMFVNIIPIRFKIEKSMMFNSYLKYIYFEWKSILRNQRYPIDLLIKDYHQINQITGDLFDVTITYQNAVFNTLVSFNQVKGRWHSNGYQTNSLNIHINDRENANSFVVDLDYLIELFTAVEITDIYHHLINLLTDALIHPKKPIMMLELLSESEKHKLLFEFNNTQTPWNKENLYQLFEKQVTQNPENTALIFENTRMTYRELNEKVSQIVLILRDKGIKSNSIVGLLLTRSLEMVIGILAILKAGGAYLPIEFNSPRERIKLILEDSNCKIVLTNNSLTSNPEWEVEIINLNTISVNKRSNNLANINHPNDLAYVIYTSGSTGKPKGVMIEHHSIVNTIKWRIRHYDFNSQDVLLQIPPYNFDSSVEDIFSFLSVGATIILIDQDKRLDLIYIKKLIAEHKVTHFLVTPLLYKTMLDEIADDLKFLTSVTIAGENFQISLVKKHFEKLPQVKLYNEYGPTENSVCSTVYQFSPHDEEVLIGQPISNCHCYVLNHDFNLQPVGISGELYLGGPGLARGYINNLELTNEKFVFVPNINERLYKTGDIVKWTPEGNLKFIERIDNQIKIRGFRVELDEIKSIILLFTAVKDAVVVAKEGPGFHTFICAYLVVNDVFDLSELREFLNLHLPYYMIPSNFIFIDHIPLTLNGKINKANLPEVIEQAKVIVMPETDNEKDLLRAWKEVFQTDIGITNDIFEYGADSIGIIQLLTILYDRNWNLSAQDFYKYRTIKKLADHISRSINSPDTMEKRNLTSQKYKTHQYKDKFNFSIKNSVHNVLLTGATGFLGSHLLYELLRTTEAQIFCLVRGSDEIVARNKFNQIINFYFPAIGVDLLNQRVFIVRGDIAQEQMGISEPEYAELFQTVDTVIHGAALVKHYGEYRDFEKINIQGLQEIIKFSTNKNLFYISTTSVSGDYATSTLQNVHFTEEHFDIGQSFHDNYYVKSKFAAEQILRNEMQNGLNASIIRIGNLTGRYIDGQFQMNIADNKFYNVLKSIVGLKVIPNSILLQKMEFTPVDKCSEAIIKIIKIPESNRRTFHLTNDHYLTLKALLKIFQNYGFEIKPLADDAFYSYLKSISTSLSQRHILFGLITDLQNGRLNYHSSIIVDSEFSKTFLHLLGFEWPAINKEYLFKLLRYMDKVNFLGDQKDYSA